jgi:hypothetical protein
LDLLDRFLTSSPFAPCEVLREGLKRQSIDETSNKLRLPGSWRTGDSYRKIADPIIVVGEIMLDHTLLSAVRERYVRRSQ